MGAKLATNRSQIMKTSIKYRCVSG